jgi:Siphovirus Gp157.
MVDTLDGIEEDFEEKAENIAAFIKSLSAEAEDLKAEESALSKRRKAKENQITYLKAYLIDNMTAIGRKLIDKPKSKDITQKQSGIGRDCQRKGVYQMG